MLPTWHVLVQITWLEGTTYICPASIHATIHATGVTAHNCMVKQKRKKAVALEAQGTLSITDHACTWYGGTGQIIVSKIA